MPEGQIIVRQSVKLIVAGYVLFALAEAAILLIWFVSGLNTGGIPFWVPMILPEVLLLFLVIRHMRRLASKLTVEGDRLRYEEGIFSKSTRTIELAKVQDVRVDQTMTQRMLNLGNLSVETAGGSSHIVMAAIDQPNQVANHILDLAKAQRAHL